MTNENKTTTQNTSSTDRPRQSRGPRTGGPRGARRPGSFERAKPEYDQKILDIRRVTRVVAGGRRMAFAVSMIIGDRKGQVGIGNGKAIDTALAIGKALKDAKKNLIRIKTTKTMSIPHEIRAKYCSSEIVLFPNKGRGLVVGSAARDILNLAGVTDVTAKVLTGSKNKINNAGATMKALMNVAERAGRKVVVAEDKKEEVSVA
jgi:small subunit ribosomal protein S5